MSSTEEVKESQNSEPIPCSTTSKQTCVIQASIERVWDIVKEGKFDWIAEELKKKPQCEVLEGANLLQVGGSRKLTYPHPTTTQVIQITEISQRRHTLGWTMITSDPAISYTSREDLISLTEVNCTPDGIESMTVVEWSSDFSSDVTIEVILDADLKKKDAFAALANIAKTV